MKIVTGSTGLPHVTSNDDGEFNQGIYGDGLVVLNNGYKLEAEIRDANTITIKDGDLVFQGRHALIEPGTTEDVTIETGTIGTKRNDLIVAHYEIDQGTGYEAITLETITGTESSTPVDPPYTEGDIRTGSIIAEVPLYRVRLNGINIDGIDALFTPQERSLLGDIEKINTDLSDRPYIVDMQFGTTNAYVKWSNGLMVCWGFSTAVFQNTSILMSNARFPVEFLSAPMVSVTKSELKGNAHVWLGFDTRIEVSNVGVTASFGTIQNNATPSDRMNWHYFAIGKWK